MATSPSLVTTSTEAWTYYSLGPTPETKTRATAIFTTSASTAIAFPRVDITLPRTCKNALVVGERLKANPDVSGLGVSTCLAGP
jgi:hypothetical protein